MKDKTTIALLALLALIVFSGSASSAHDKSSKGAGKHVRRRSTGSKDEHAWTLSRFKAARSLLKMAAPDLPDHDAVARSVVAHWGIETAWGKAENNWNVGNIRPVKGQAFFSLPEAGDFRAFGSLTDGITAYAKLLQNGYAECMMSLAMAPETADWFQCLADHHYFGDPKDVRAIYTAARARVEKATQ